MPDRDAVGEGVNLGNSWREAMRLAGVLADQHKLFRRLALVWACWLITWTVLRVFTDAPVIEGGTAAALATVCGLLTVVIGFYQWSRDREGVDAKERIDASTQPSPKTKP